MVKMSKVLLFYKTGMINISPKNVNTWHLCEGEICTQHQIKQSVFT